MSKRMVIFALICGVCLGAVVARGEDDASAAVNFQNAYKMLSQADAKRDSGQLSEAVSLYSEALMAYNTLSSQYPDWQANVVKFRIAYCNEQVETLLKNLSAIGDSANRKTQAKKDTIHAQDSSQRIKDITAAATNLLKDGQHVKARLILLEGMDIDPDNRSIRLLLSMAQCQAGRYNDAIYILRELIKENPADHRAYLTLGTAYYATGEIAGAINEIKKALEIDPEMKEAHFNMAQVLLDSTPPDPKTALEHYKKALQLGIQRDKATEDRFRSMQTSSK